MCKTAKTSSILLQILNWGHQDPSAVHGSAAALWAAHRPLWGREHRATNPTPHTHPAAAALGLGSQHRTLQDSWFQFTLAIPLGFRGSTNSKPGARQPGSPSQASPSHVVFLIKGWSVVPIGRSTDCRVELAVGCRDSTGCQGQGGHEDNFTQHCSGLSTYSWGRNNHRNLPVSQQFFYSPVHRKALAKKKLRKGNSRHLSIPARGRSNKDCCRRKEHTGAALTHTSYLDSCHSLG